MAQFLHYLNYQQMTFLLLFLTHFENLPYRAPKTKWQACRLLIIRFTVGTLAY